MHRVAWDAKREMSNPSPPSTLMLSLAKQNKSQEDPATKTGMTRYAHGYNNHTNVPGVTNQFLIGFESLLHRLSNTCLELHFWNPWLGSSQPPGVILILLIAKWV